MPLFAYPPQSAKGQPLPKARLLAQAPKQRGLKARLSEQVDSLTWAWVLAPQSLGLAATAEVAEIQVFRLRLKPGIPGPDPHLVRAIDQSIPSPILFEVEGEAGLCTLAAYKRPNEADPARWVLGELLAGPWLPADAVRQPLPVALDMGGLYRSLLRALIPLPARPGEGLRAQLDRLAQVRQAERDCQRLAAQLAAETHFKRKVELNRHLRERRTTLEQLRQHAGAPSGT